MVVRQNRAGQRERHFVAHPIIFCAANNLPRLTAAVVDLADGEPIGIRVWCRGGDLRDHNLS